MQSAKVTLRLAIIAFALAKLSNEVGKDWSCVTKFLCNRMNISQKSDSRIEGRLPIDCRLSLVISNQ